MAMIAKKGQLSRTLLYGVILYATMAAKVLEDQHLRRYNRVRPDSSLGSWPPTPEAIRRPRWGR